MRISLLKRTAEGLDRLFAPFSAGELKQYELPLAVEQFYQLGLVQGMAYAQQQAREYEHKLNLLYMQAFTPKERHAEYQRRLDKHFADQCERFFAEPVIEGPAPETTKESVCHHSVMNSGTLAPSFKPSDNKHAHAA